LEFIHDTETTISALFYSKNPPEAAAAEKLNSKTCAYSGLYYFLSWCAYSFGKSTNQYNCLHESIKKAMRAAASAASE
jgi:hypothetical protein